eukprot:s49_g72.t1
MFAAQRCAEQIVAAEYSAFPTEMPQVEADSKCPGCGLQVADLRRHMKRCCPEKLPERLAPAEERRVARKAASEEDWISEEEVKEAALKSFSRVEDPLLRRVLELRFGADQGGLRRSPAEVAEALGGKYRGKAEAYTGYTVELFCIDAKLLEPRGGTWADVEEAAAGGWQKQAITAMLQALADGHAQAADLLFYWGVAPDVGLTKADAPKPGEMHILILGWGGSTCSQLEVVQKWWQGRGFPTFTTTFCSKMIEKQLCDIKAFLPSGADVLIHAFSNNGMYLLQSLCRDPERSWRLAGVIVDSAPDVNISPTLMRQVVNGCIRALCLFNRITIEKKAEAVLTDLNVVGPLRVGDCISVSSAQPPVVSAASGEPRGVLLTTKGMISKQDEEAISGFLDRPLQGKDLHQLKSFQVSKVEIEEISDFLAKEEAPVLFLYSSSDTLIKPAAVEEYIKTCTREGQASSKRFAGSQHVRHFQKHFDEYAAELIAFTERCRDVSDAAKKDSC